MIHEFGGADFELNFLRDKRTAPLLNHFTTSDQRKIKRCRIAPGGNYRIRLTNRKAWKNILKHVRIPWKKQIAIKI